jgi:pimeloyl-ACP methyl ester carboxylesterase
MLYELAVPALLLRAVVSRSRPDSDQVRPIGFRMRAARSRLQRLELDLLARLSPLAGAWLVLRRVERIDRRHRLAIGIALDVPTVVTAHGAPFARVVGPDEGPRLLLIHGLNSDGTMVLPLAKCLAERGFRVTVPDLPCPVIARRGRLNLELVARRLVETCDPLGPFDAVIGHSAGGLVAAIAVARGLRATRLATICSPSSLDSLLGGYLTFTSAPAGCLPAVRQLYRALRRRDPATVGPGEYAAFGSNQMVIHARNDWHVSPAAAHAICAGRPGQSPVVLSDCNHNSILRDPRLAEALCDFASGRVQRGSPSC